MDSATLKLINRRNLHMRRFKKYKNTPDLKAAKHLRTKITSTVQKAWGAFVTSRLDRHKKDPKRFWREMNKLIKPSRSKVKIKLKDEKSFKIVEDTSNYINNYYGKIGEELAREQNTVHPPYSPPDETYQTTVHHCKISIRNKSPKQYTAWTQVNLQVYMTCRQRLWRI